MNSLRLSTIKNSSAVNIMVFLSLFLPVLTLAQEEYQEVNPNKESHGFSLIEKWAMYPGGEIGISNYIHRELKYPKSAIRDSIEGVVIVKYVVQTDGRVDEVEIIQSAHPILDEEAKRVIQVMDKWKPAIQGGTAVKLAYEQVFNFKL